MIEKRVSNVGILYIRCMRKKVDYITHAWIGQCAACDRYRKSRYSPHTSDTQYAYV